MGAGRGHALSRAPSGPDETDAGGAGETGPRVAIFPLGSDKPKVALYLPDGMGDPASARWVGEHSILVNGTSGDGFAVFDVEVGRWVAFVRTPPPVAPRIPSAERVYQIVPAAGGKARLVAVEWPFNDYFKDRDAAVSTQSITSYVLTAEGLKK